MESLAYILDQHSEEIAFLSLLRTRAVHAPHYDLAHLATLDNRIEAHLDGLRVASDAGLEALLGRLPPHAEGEVFAATVLAFEMDASAALTKLAEHLRSHPHSERFVATALGWLKWPRVSPRIDRMLASPEPLFRRLGLAACGMHRRDPRAALTAGLSNADSGVLARTARTAGELRRRDLMPAIRAHRLHADEHVHFWANWATAQMADKEALEPLRQFAKQANEFSWYALPVLIAWQDHADSIAWLRALAQDPAQRRLAIRGAGLCGDPVSIP